MRMIAHWTQGRSFSTFLQNSFFFLKSFLAVLEVYVNTSRNHNLKLWGWGIANSVYCANSYIANSFYSVGTNFLLAVRGNSFVKNSKQSDAKSQSLIAKSCEF